MKSASKWSLVLARDSHHDGKFFYAVNSTGIYCRPSCPSRRPRRAAVKFFSTAQQAESAGYRACKRCRPNAVARQFEVVQAACRLMESQPEPPLTLPLLSQQVGVSPFHLQRMFKKVLGVSPREYQEARRLEQFKGKLKQGQDVTGALYEAGFGSSSRVYEKSDRQLGMTPSRYRRHGAGAEIRYTILDSPLGKLLIAATAKGICSIRFSTGASALEKELRTEFAAASLRRDDAGLQHLAKPVLEHLAGRQVDLNLPVDVQATAFQRQVWNVLKNIPRGETRSYSQVATELGAPKSVRAVARACATNPVAVVIPCHRVLHKSSSASGYRWGKQRKKKLLQIEGAQARASSAQAAGRTR